MSRRRLALAVIVGTVGLTACGAARSETPAATAAPTTTITTTTVQRVTTTVEPHGMTAAKYRLIQPGTTTCAELDAITGGGTQLSENMIGGIWTAAYAYSAATGYGNANVIVQNTPQQPCVVVSKAQYGLS